MAFDRIDGDADDLDAALAEFALDAGHCAQLGGADGREILRVREENSPAVADPLMEIDGAGSGFGGEVRSDIVDAKAHVSSSLSCGIAGAGPRKCNRGGR